MSLDKTKAKREVRRGLDRRELVNLAASCAAVSAATPLFGSTALATSNSRGLLMAPERFMKGSRWQGALGIIDLKAQVYGKILTHDLVGHALARHPDGRTLCMFGQRPARHSCIIDLGKREVVKVIEAANKRHFYGHGSFSPDGKFLYCSENDFESNRGTITIRDTATYKLVGELSTFGYGPHEIVHLQKSNQFVVANGGDVPETPIGKVGKSIGSSLCYIDASTGKLVEQQVLPPNLGTLSIRHLAVAEDESFVAVGMRDYEFKSAMVGCFAIHRRGRAIESAVALAQTELDSMGANALSVAVDLPNATACTTHPDKNCVVVWRIDPGKSPALIARHATGSPEGGALLPGHIFVATTRAGKLIAFDSRSGAEKPLPWLAAIRGLDWRHAAVF